MKTKREIILLLISLLVLFALYLGVRYLYYGSLTRNCIYTENSIPVPEQLAKGEIVVAKDAYLAVGYDREYVCLKNFGSIDRMIVGSHAMNNQSAGRQYFTDKGLTVESLKTSTSFRITNVVAVTKHGFTTIDSGPGPIYFLILKDKNNTLYRLATYSLGLNNKDLFLSFVDSSQPVNSSSTKFLSGDSFDTTWDHEGENSLTYTGKLTNLP